MIREPHHSARSLGAYGVTKEVASSLKLKMIDGVKIMDESTEKDPGILWHDGVHLTDLGQYLFAEGILESLL